MYDPQNASKWLLKGAREGEGRGGESALLLPCSVPLLTATARRRTAFFVQISAALFSAYQIL